MNSGYLLHARTVNLRCCLLRSNMDIATRIFVLNYRFNFSNKKFDGFVMQNISFCGLLAGKKVAVVRFDRCRQTLSWLVPIDTMYAYCADMQCILAAASIMQSGVHVGIPPGMVRRLRS